MGASAPKQPKQPNPAKVSKKQLKFNEKAARLQQQLNMVDEVTPEGTKTYAKGPDGRYVVTTTLTPEAEAARKLNEQFDTQSNQVALNQLGNVSETLSQPLDMSTTAIEDHLFDLANSRIAPQLEQRRAALEQRLYNQGVQPGTEAYRRAMEQDTQGANDAYNQLFLNGRAQGVSELMAARNQPLNELSALLGLTQVQQPNWPGAPQVQIGQPDYMGQVQANQAANNAWATNAMNQEYGQQNAMMGALGGVAGTALGGWGQSGFKF
jgi:hypothetical protein